LHVPFGDGEAAARWVSSRIGDGKAAARWVPSRIGDGKATARWVPSRIGDAVIEQSVPEPKKKSLGKSRGIWNLVGKRVTTCPARRRSSSPAVQFGVQLALRVGLKVLSKSVQLAVQFVLLLTHSRFNQDVTNARFKMEIIPFTTIVADAPSECECGEN
jgi:hypothetical protein